MPWLVDAFSCLMVELAANIRNVVCFVCLLARLSNRTCKTWLSGVNAAVVNSAAVLIILSI